MLMETLIGQTKDVKQFKKTKLSDEQGIKILT